MDIEFCTHQIVYYIILIVKTNHILILIQIQLAKFKAHGQFLNSFWVCTIFMIVLGDGYGLQYKRKLDFLR